MLSVSSLEEYEAYKRRASACRGLVVHFSASWCTPCEAVRELLVRKAAEYGPHELLFCEVSADTHEDICAKEGIESVPYVAFFRSITVSPEKDNEEGGDAVRAERTKEDNNNNDGNVRRDLERVADVAGAKLDVLEMNLCSLYGTPDPASQRAHYDKLDDYLRYLTTRPGIVLFLTGTPSRPRCGFTGRLCEMLQNMHASYVYYDVMASEEVCQGLKEFSQWPTYPQVYVDGELIGGYDICKELDEAGELKQTLKV